MKRLISSLLVLVLIGVCGISFAGEVGRRNTRNILAVATLFEASQGHKTNALIGAGATLLAQAEYDKSIRDRHERDAWIRGYECGRHHHDRGRHEGWYR